MAARHCLVLNPDALPLGIMPLSTLSWEDAISVVYRERVDVLHTYEDWEVHSPSRTYAVPSVVMKHDFVGKWRHIKFSKPNVYLRDGYTCQFCLERFDVKDLTWDHVIPRARGGKTRWDNVSTACGPCNFEKGHHETMQPKTKPWKPTYYELVELMKKNEVMEIGDPIWNEYLMWPEDRIKVIPPNKRAA